MAASAFASLSVLRRLCAGDHDGNAIDKVEQGDAPRERLWNNVAHFRQQMAAARFGLAGADHPVGPGCEVGDYAPFGIDDFQQGFDAMNSGQSGKLNLNWE